MKKITFNNSIIEYSESGKEGSPVLLFVHGLGANLEQFSSQQKFFSERYRVVSINLPGHGNSTLPDNPSLQSFSEAVIMLMDSIGAGSFHFIGNSMGGNIGYVLMDNHQSRLLSFTTFGTTAELHVARGTTVILLAVYRLLSMNAVASMSAAAGRTEDAKIIIKSMMKKMDKQNLLKIIPILADFNFLDIIGVSGVPAMILQGGKDSDINRNIESTINTFKNRGGFNLKTFEQAGHFINLDCPDDFNKTVSDFIDSTGG